MITEEQITKGIIVHSLRKEDIVIDYRARAWCKLTYPGHSKGCPNWGKREGCPPKAKLFEQVVKPPFTLVAVKFNLDEHARRMKEKHPDWSDRQVRCVLYWQRKLDKKLREESEKVASKILNSHIVYKPEAHGIQLFKTCENIGLILERNPQNILWKMTIVGIKNK